MKKNLKKLLLMILLMATLAACTNKSEDTPNPSAPENGAASNDQSSNEPASSEAPQKPDFAGQTLSISVTDLTNYHLGPYVERFKAAYPGVEIALNKYEWGIYNQQIGTQLMAGEADDIVEAGWVDIRKLLETGLVADFYPLMQNDPNFHEEDYYMDVFDSMTYKGKLTIFPTYFSYNLIGVNSQVSEQLKEQFNSYETITCREVLDLYNNLEDRGGRYLCCGANSEILFLNSFYSYIDFENEKCYFDTPEFIQFLTDYKNSTSPKATAHSKGESPDLPPQLDKPGVLEEFALQYLFQLFSDLRYCEYLMFLPDAEKEIFTHFIPIATDTNELIIQPFGTYHISETSQNKELAWEFIKFLTTPEANENLSLIGMPVNREMVKTFAPSNMRWTINNYKGKGFTIDGEEADVVTQVMSEFAQYNELPMKCYAPGVDSKFYWDDFLTFLDGALTAEQAAAAIQNKVSLYLME